MLTWSFFWTFLGLLQPFPRVFRWGFSVLFLDVLYVWNATWLRGCFGSRGLNGFQNKNLVARKRPVSEIRWFSLPKTLKNVLGVWVVLWLHLLKECGFSHLQARFLLQKPLTTSCGYGYSNHQGRPSIIVQVFPWKVVYSSRIATLQISTEAWATSSYCLFHRYLLLI